MGNNIIVILFLIFIYHMFCHAILVLVKKVEEKLVETLCSSLPWSTLHQQIGVIIML